MQVKHRAEALVNANHYDPQGIRDISEEVTKRWQQLVTCAEERHKLVTASLNFFKTAEQVSFLLFCSFRNLFNPELMFSFFIVDLRCSALLQESYILIY